MKKIRLAKDAEAFRKLEKWHQVFEEKLSFPFQRAYVPTPIGETEVLISGPQNGTPLVILHGAMSGAPFALGELGTIPTRFRCYAINIPGQSVRAPEIRLAFDGKEYGCWLESIFNHFGITHPILAGVSYGGSVALQHVIYAPKSISGLLLVVPGSIVRGPFWESMRKITLPLICYKLRPSPKNRDRFFKSMLTTSDVFWTPYLHDAMDAYNPSYARPPLLGKEHLSQFRAPIYIIAADEDLYFPGQKMLERAKEIFSNLIGSHLLLNTKHCPSFCLQDRVAFEKVFLEGLLQLGACQPTKV